MGRLKHYIKIIEDGDGEMGGCNERMVCIAIIISKGVGNQSMVTLKYLLDAPYLQNEQKVKSYPLVL